MKRLRWFFGASVWVVLFWLSGCAALGMRGELMAVEGADDAVWIVWHDVYGRRDQPPKVRWVTGAELTCAQANGITGFPTPMGCRGGWTLSPLSVSVSLHDAEPLSDTPLAHELRHAADLRDGIGDPDHRGAQWRPLEECGPSPALGCGIVQRAVERLQARGL